MCAALGECFKLSSKVQDLQAKDLEQEKLRCLAEELSQVHQELNNMEQLKDQLKAWESQVEAGEVERLAVVQQLQGREEEIGALAQERDELKQMLEAVQRERDQVKEDIEETVAMVSEPEGIKWGVGGAAGQICGSGARNLARYINSCVF